MPGLLNDTPQYLPFSSVGPRTQKVLARAQNAAYEPYQEAEQQGNPWINYNPLLTLDSMYRAGQEGIGETIRQVGDAWGYPSQGKEAASGVNSGLEYLASRGGSDFSTLGFGVPIEANPARYVDTPKVNGMLIAHGGYPRGKQPWDFVDSEGPGMWFNEAETGTGYGQYTTNDRHGRHPGVIGETQTYDVPAWKSGQWLEQGKEWGNYSSEMQQKMKSVADKHGMTWRRGVGLGEEYPWGKDHFNNVEPIDPYTFFWEELGRSPHPARKELWDEGIPGWAGTDDGHGVIIDPDSAKMVGRHNAYPDAQSRIFKDGKPSVDPIADINMKMYGSPDTPTALSRRQLDWSDIGWNPYKHLLSAGALSTQDAPLSFPRRR